MKSHLFTGGTYITLCLPNPYILIFSIIAFKKSLEDAIASDTSGHFKRILIALAQVHLHSSHIQTLTHSSYFVLYKLIFHFTDGVCQGAREEGPVDMARALEDAQVSVKYLQNTVKCWWFTKYKGNTKVFNVFTQCKELAEACNADSGDMEDKFMSILCTRSFPHLRKGNANTFATGTHANTCFHERFSQHLLYLLQCSRNLWGSATKISNKS